MTTPELDDHDIGHGVLLRWDDDGQGFIWKHPGCRAWCTLRLKPDATSTGHVLASGGPSDIGSLTIEGVCSAVRNGRWVPA